MLEVHNLSVSYGIVRALRSISITVRSSEVVCLVGANGAGKSSCLMGIMGLAVGAGEILLDGTRIDSVATYVRVRSGLALVPEGRHVFPDMTVEENLRLGFRHGHPDLFTKRLSTVLEAFPRLKERFKQRAGTLSGGEQQMLVIGRGLMSGPNILLLDEPMLGLAPIMVQHVAEIIKKLRREGLGILLAEQNLHIALSVANRGYVLENGAVATEGTSDILINDTRVQRAYLGIQS